MGDQFRADAGPLGETTQIPIQGVGQAQVVQHRGMQQLGEIAHCMQRPVCNRAGFSQRHPAFARPLQMAFGHCQFHLDGRQRLADFVVQLPGDAPPLLLLGAHQLGGKPLQLPLVLDILQMLLKNPALQPPSVVSHQEGNAQAQQQCQAAGPPHLVLDLAVDEGQLLLLPLQGITI